MKKYFNRFLKSFLAIIIILIIALSYMSVYAESNYPSLPPNKHPSDQPYWTVAYNHNTGQYLVDYTWAPYVFQPVWNNEIQVNQWWTSVQSPNVHTPGSCERHVWSPETQAWQLFAYHPSTGYVIKISEGWMIIDANYPYQVPREVNGLFTEGSVFGFIEGLNIEYRGFLGDVTLKLDKVGAGANASLAVWKFPSGSGNITIPKEEIPITSDGTYKFIIYDGDNIVEERTFTYNYEYNTIEVEQSPVDKTPLADELPGRIKAYISESTPYKPMMLSLERLKTFDTSDYRTLCPELHINLGDLLDASSSHIAPDLVGKLNIDVIYFDLSILNQIEFLGVPVIQYMRTLLSMCMIFFTALHIYHGFIPDKVIVGG